MVIILNLAENGTNLYSNASISWIGNVWQWSKPIIAPGLIPEISLTFYKNINAAVRANKIPEELIINIDQTPLPFVLTVEEKGASGVPVPGTADYRQITFAVANSGDFLPIQLINMARRN